MSNHQPLIYDKPKQHITSPSKQNQAFARIPIQGFRFQKDVIPNWASPRLTEANVSFPGMASKAHPWSGR